jgi:ABC-type lipoprotein release transport system permease subunit
VLQGLLGGVLGALIGIGGAALVTALAPTLEATVAGSGGNGPRNGPGGGVVFGLGRAADAVTSGTEKIALSAPVDVGLIALAIGLALLGGLIAGSAGGLRASRLRPADALRHID